MKETFLTLNAETIATEQALADIYELLSGAWDEIDTPERAIVVGYYLHNLYMAFEHIFERVAETFENHIEDKSQWHAHLLRRMKLDIAEMRPRLIGAETYECLDELRRFRHVFRSAYSIKLDLERLALVVGRPKRLKELYRADLLAFKNFLDQAE